MKLATTIGDFVKYTDSNKERLLFVREAGFHCADFNFYKENTPSSRFMQNDWRDCAEQLKAYADGIGLELIQAHSPDTNPLSDDPGIEYTLRSIEVCGVMGIPNTVVHPGWADGIGKDEFFERNRDYFRRLMPTAERCGVNVLIENSAHSNMGEKYYFYTGADMREFVEFFDHPRLRVCWDTGHANIEGGQYQQIKDIGEYLYALHFNDNTGLNDMHIMPYIGTMNPDEVMCALMDIGYRGALTFEADSTLRFARGWPYRRRKFDGENRAADPTLRLQKAAEKLLYEVGVRILTAYGCCEE